MTKLLDPVAEILKRQQAMHDLQDALKQPPPDENPKTVFGMRKIALDLVPPSAIKGLAEAFENGAGKYGPFNWREKKISSTVYYAAAMRHLTDWYDRIDPDDQAPDSGIHHLKHAMACLAMIVDTMGSYCLNDNRPPAVKR